MNSLSYKIQEEYGAGFEGTDELRKKYIQDTPGQRIQQFKTTMNHQTYKTYQEFAAQHKKMYPTHTSDQVKAAWETYSKAFEMEEANNLSYIGNCTDDEVVDHIFGDASGFANAVEKYGNDFVLDDLVVKYDRKKDIHSFYYKEQIVKEKLNASMSESQNLISKGIYTLDGKKIEGSRSSKLFLQGLDADGFLHDLSWKEWSESNLKDTSSDNAKKQFVERLAKQIKMFNKKIDLNQFLKSGNIGFIDTVNYIFKLDPNIKYSKASGLKEEALQDTPGQRIQQFKTTMNQQTYKTYQEFAAQHKKMYPTHTSDQVKAAWETYSKAFEMEEAVKKIACLECDEVSTEAAWKKNNGFCPVCKVSTKAVAESSDLEEAINTSWPGFRYYVATSEKSQFGGYRPKVLNKDGTTVYLSQASYNTSDEAKEQAEDYIEQLANGIREPIVKMKGTYRLKEEKESYDSWIIKPRDGGKEVKVKAVDKTSAIEIALGRKPSQNEIDFFNFHYILIQEKTNVATLRHMKIVELATKCTDSNLVQTFVEQQYKPQTSALQIKESFRSFVASQKA